MNFDGPHIYISQGILYSAWFCLACLDVHSQSAWWAIRYIASGTRIAEAEKSDFSSGQSKLIQVQPLPSVKGGIGGQ